MRRAPDFWWDAQPGPLARLLQPLGSLYGSLTARRMARSGRVLPVPVLCVGNFVVGGAGKTPAALALAELLRAKGHAPAFLSRGYGRQGDKAALRAVLRVDLDQHHAAHVGDEPLLLAAEAPTYVSTDRWASGRQAIDEGATVLVLDDGLQNPSLAKSAAFAVIDAGTGIGNGLCFPAGPLRAPLASQWPAVQACLLVGVRASDDSLAAEAFQQGKTVLRAKLAANLNDVAALSGLRLFAFAGIGRPEKFLATLESCGLDVVASRSFPDHHAYSRRDRETLLALAERHQAHLVTTAKDRVRLPSGFPVVTLGVRLAFDDPDAVGRVLSSAVGEAGAPVPPHIPPASVPR